MTVPSSVANLWHIWGDINSSQMSQTNCVFYFISNCLTCTCWRVFWCYCWFKWKGVVKSQLHCKKSYFSFVKSTFSILPTTSTFVQSSSKTIRSKMWIILFANAMLQTKTIILLCTKSPCTFYKCEILFFAVYFTQCLFINIFKIFSVWGGTPELSKMLEIPTLVVS